MMRTIFCALAVLLSVTAVGADESTLADRGAAQLRSALPGYDIVVVDPLTVKIGLPGQVNTQINFDRIDAFCKANPDSCDSELSDFTQKAAGIVREQGAALPATSLRAVIRTRDYVEALERLNAKGGPFISAPFAGDMVMICYFDTPSAMRPATGSEIEKLGLTPDKALEACKANVHAALPPLATAAKDASPDDLGVLGEDNYTSSYLLFHDDWRDIAARFGGHLLVAVPSAETILFVAEKNAASLDAFSKVVDKAFQTGHRPLSPKVYRWTPTGWDVVAP